MIRQVFDLDGGTVFVGIDFIEELAVAVQYLGGDRGRRAGEFGGAGNIFEKPDEGRDEDENDGGDDNTDNLFIDLRKSDFVE